MGWRDFESVEPNAAEALAEAWWATQGSRLRWLHGELGTDDPDLTSVWSWYLTQQHAGRIGEGEPLPVWWDEDTPDDADLPGRDQAVRLDACFHLLTHRLTLRHPRLERWVPRVNGRRRTLYDNLPTLALRNDARVVFAWSPVRALGSVGVQAFRGVNVRPERLNDLYRLLVQQVDEALGGEKT